MAGVRPMMAGNIAGGLITIQGIVNIANPEWFTAGWQTTLTLVYLLLCTVVNLWVSVRALVRDDVWHS